MKNKYRLYLALLSLLWLLWLGGYLWMAAGTGLSLGHLSLAFPALMAGVFAWTSWDAYRYISRMQSDALCWQIEPEQRRLVFQALSTQATSPKKAATIALAFALVSAGFAALGLWLQAESWGLKIAMIVSVALYMSVALGMDNYLFWLPGGTDMCLWDDAIMIANVWVYAPQRAVLSDRKIDALEVDESSGLLRLTVYRKLRMGIIQSAAFLLPPPRNSRQSQRLYALIEQHKQPLTEAERARKQPY